MRLMILQSERPKDDFEAELKREFPGIAIAVEQITDGFRVTYDWGHYPHSRPRVHSFIRGWRAATLHMGREPAREEKSNEQLVKAGNDLARMFYAAHGYQVPEGYRFDQAGHSQERSMWNLTVIAFYAIEGTDLVYALDELEAEGE